jgi:diguanylate cyclase (GGDEF)-like protein/PAS domain S-box-containing protein
MAPQTLSNLIATGAAIACIAVGAIVTVAWQVGWEELKTFVPGTPPMKPNTAFALMLAGLALWCLRAAPVTPLARRVAQACIGLFVALALATLAQYAFDVDLHIDHVLAFEYDADDDVLPSRMAAVTATNFVLAGFALLLVDVRSRSGRRPSDWLALALVVNAFVVLLGYVYGLETLYRIAADNPVSAPTALMLLVLAAGIAFARADSHFVRRVTADDSGGRIVRRLLPAAVMLPPLLGWMRWRGEYAGWYSTAFGLALYAVANIAVFAVLVWISAHAVQRVADRESSTARANAWQQAILNGTDFIVISTDTAGVILTLNATALERLGYVADELVGRMTLDALQEPVELASRARRLSLQRGERVDAGFAVLVAAAGRTGDEHDWTWRQRDGVGFPVRLSLTAIVDADGRTSGYLAIGKDLTAQREAERTARECDRRLRLIVDNVPDLIAYVDRDRCFRFNNLAWADWLIQPLDDVQGRRVDESHAPGVYALFAPYLERALAGERLTFEVAVPRAGEVRHLRGTYVPDLRHDGSVAGTYGVVSDITDLKLAEAQLRHIAQYDTLTGLANRATFNARARDAIGRSEASGSAMALVFLDVDHFKTIDDRYGHAGGDRVLQAFAERLSQCTRDTDTVARIAGDEFVVVLEPLAVPDDARRIGEAIVERLRHDLDIDGTCITLSASIGIALRRQGEFDTATILRRADEALYRAKQQGRARLCIVV